MHTGESGRALPLRLPLHSVQPRYKSGDDGAPGVEPPPPGGAWFGGTICTWPLSHDDAVAAMKLELPGRPRVWNVNVRAALPCASVVPLATMLPSSNSAARHSAPGPWQLR